MAAVLSCAVAVAQSASIDREFFALQRAQRLDELAQLAIARLAADPADDVARWHRSRNAAGDASQRDALQRDFERCLEQRPQSARCQNGLAMVLGSSLAERGLAAGVSSVGRIRALLEEAARYEPTHLGLQRDVAQFYLYTPALLGGSVRKARQIAAALASYSGVYQRIMLADIASYEKNWDAAEQQLVGLSADPDLAVQLAALDAEFTLGIRLIEAEQLSRAAQLFRRFVAREPRWANAHFGLGRVLLAQSQNAAAIASLLTALQLNPQVRAHYRLGLAYEAQGDEAQAVAMYRQFLSYQSRGSQAENARLHIERLSRPGAQ
jgi:tetratricopeptide (TPR) repeat protein